MAKSKGSSIVKAGAESTALAKLEDWEIEAQASARAEKAKEVLGIPRITHKGSIIKIDDKPVKGNTLRHVIVDFIFSKAYYTKEYDPNGPPQTPVCYAYGREEAGMVPHAESSKKQHDQCGGCPHNKFNTAEKGRGKRCKDERKVAAIVELTKPTDIAKAEVRQYSVPPGSLRNWGNYLSSLNEVTPTGDVRSVLTELGAQPMDTGAYSLNFTAIEKLTKEFHKAVLARKAGLEAQMFAPWPQITEEEAPKGKAKKVKGQGK
jgi:hypothetical protein